MQCRIIKDIVTINYHVLTLVDFRGLATALETVCISPLLQIMLHL